jgi:pimeloyl-ACP methyl ester carboxylesterase
MDVMEKSGRLDRGNGTELAWTLQEGDDPAVVFLPGFRSDMTGDKATRLATFCAEAGRMMLRFDYSGHGASGGDFLNGTIGVWLQDTLAVIDRLTTGRLVLVGSSMGGWIALLAARARPQRVAALVGIAAAPDFTQKLMWEAMAPPERSRLMQDGVIHVPSQYGEPTPITRALIEDGKRHLLLDAPIALQCPVRLLHGQNDPDVPWELALRIAERVASKDVQIILVKDGDHRLSRAADLDLLCRTVAPFFGQDGSQAVPEGGIAP